MTSSVFLPRVAAVLVRDRESNKQPTKNKPDAEKKQSNSTSSISSDSDSDSSSSSTSSEDVPPKPGPSRVQHQRRRRSRPKRRQMTTWSCASRRATRLTRCGRKHKGFRSWTSERSRSPPARTTSWQTSRRMFLLARRS